MNPSAHPTVEPRSLLGLAEAGELAGRFEVLASPTRLRLLQALLVLDDPCMSDLASAVGMKPQAVSNQLRKLADLGVLHTRRHGNHIHYRIVESGVSSLLHQILCLPAEQPQHSQSAS